MPKPQPRRNPSGRKSVRSRCPPCVRRNKAAAESATAANAARAKGIRYNRFIAGIYESLGLRDANLLRDAAVDVRMDPILLYDAEQVLGKLGMTHSEAVAEFYRKLAKEGNLDFLK